MEREVPQRNPRSQDIGRVTPRQVRAIASVDVQRLCQ
jgi:hypothetical protein